jgi:hypothetical protein
MSTRDENHVASAFRRTDERIDAAARDLTRGAPSPRLRHAVRRRIEPRQPRARIWLWLPVFAGALAVLLLAIAQQWRSPEVPATPARMVATQDAPLAVAPPTPAVAVRTAAVPPVRARRARPIRPLAPIEPLVLEPIAMPVIAVTTSSGVTPIEIEPLRVEPLQPQ